MMLMRTLYNVRRPAPFGDVAARLKAAAPVVDMNAGFDATFAYIIGYGVPGYGVEGGEANNPSDPGGFTWRGITLTDYRAWLGNPRLTPTNLLQASEDAILAFYGANYWNAVCGASMPASVALVTTDFAVNAGPYTSATTLQTALGFSGSDVDGSIGPDTLGAVAKANQTTLVWKFSQLRQQFYNSIGNAAFIQGWTNRVDSCQAAAMALVPETT